MTFNDPGKEAFATHCAKSCRSQDHQKLGLCGKEFSHAILESNEHCCLTIFPASRHTKVWCGRTVQRER